MFDLIQDTISALLWPEKSCFTTGEFLGFSAGIILVCIAFVFGMVLLPESILVVIVVIVSSVIGLGTFMAKFSSHYLKAISLRGFGFLIFVVLAYFMVQTESFPTEDTIVNWL